MNIVGSSPITVRQRALSVGQWAATVGALAAVLLVVAAVAPVLFGRQVYIVTGGSMEPAIPLGSAVVSERTRAILIKEGDVITYVNRQAHIVTHRVTEVVSDQFGPGFRTKGDANEDPDQEIVRPVNVVGRVWYYVPLVGYILHYANQSATKLAFLVLAIMIVGWQLQAWAFRRTATALPTGQAGTLEDGKASIQSHQDSPTPLATSVLREDQRAQGNAAKAPSDNPEPPRAQSG